MRFEELPPWADTDESPVDFVDFVDFADFYLIVRIVSVGPYHNHRQMGPAELGAFMCGGVNNNQLKGNPQHTKFTDMSEFQPRL